MSWGTSLVDIVYCLELWQTCGVGGFIWVEERVLVGVADGVFLEFRLSDFGVLGWI